MKKKLGDFTTPYKEAIDEAKRVLLVTEYSGIYTLLKRKYPTDERLSVQVLKNAYQGRANNKARWLTPLIESLYKGVLQESE